MNYEESAALRASAQPSVLFTRALLGSLTQDEQRDILQQLDSVFSLLAGRLHFQRRLTPYGSLGARYLWLPNNGGPGPLLTDLDFIRDPRLHKLAAFRYLRRRISRNQPQIAVGLITSLLIARDWELHDYESIVNAQEVFDTFQIAANAESASRRLAKRTGGFNKSASDRKRHSEMEKRVTSACLASIRAGHNRHECWEHVHSRCESRDGYPSKTTLRRVFRKVYAAASIEPKAAS